VTASQLFIGNESQGSEDSQSNDSCGCNPVLVVDDNDFNLFTFREIMETTHKIPSDGAVNGLDAVTKFEKSLSCCPYRVVFMDVNMPVMNGIEAT
jgi:CheY-like chemotaxis protein